jgi:copper(I)-binding protein
MTLIAQACLLSMASLAAAPSSAALTVVSVWSRATAPGATVGVAYFEIVNAGAADVLTAIETPVAQQVQMHSMNTVDGVMQMRLTPAVAVPAGGRVLFMPGGLHAMLIDLKHPLRAGERFALTLVFAHAGRVRVEAHVEALGSLAPSARRDDHEPLPR